ncbi:uncharacterized protein LOC112055580 [Bicyclus anynana]|uniref:ascorbate ferrireductase (transmembrane) n=1 Tax=Bicyclus anynana TaxID=110368 RepID=A0A6J1NXX2_BICAN|nr:uncharacterized protein LOC112055580 [Bicyclus anynana]
MEKSETEVNGTKIEVERDSYYLRIFQSTLNLIAHLLIGAVVGICIIFAFRNGVPMNTTKKHVILCVLGYQLLMAEAILALCPHNGWTAGLRLLDKRRAHTVLLIMGSVLAIVGSLLMSAHKTVNFNTVHGKYGLVALVFTTVSLVNGLTSLYGYELRKYIPENFSKIPHIIFGVIAFVSSLICLCYGLDYDSFKEWSSRVGAPYGCAYTVMGLAAAYTFIIIINPVITAFNKSKRMYTIMKL